ncbi:MAG TPA: pyridoxal 5'-phosphate synthase lyase subunit PdxS, partial [Candidatus Poseidoniales archaeon]
MKTDFSQLRMGSDLLKRGFARMQQGGVIMDVVNPEQA